MTTVLVFTTYYLMTDPKSQSCHFQWKPASFFISFSLDLLSLCHFLASTFVHIIPVPFPPFPSCLFPFTSPYRPSLIIRSFLQCFVSSAVLINIVTKPLYLRTFSKALEC